MTILIESTLTFQTQLNNKKKAAEASRPATGTSSPPEPLKRNTLLELLNTEERYLSRLRRAKDAYRIALEQELNFVEPVISRDEIEQLFGNVDEITAHSSELLEGLRSSLAHLTPPGGVPAPAAKGSVGAASVLRASMDKITVYKPYVMKCDRAIKLLLSLQATRPRLKALLQLQRQQGTVARGALPTDPVQPLDSYLMEPFQRVLRYKMLLEQALSPKCEWTAGEREELRQALGSVSGLADQMNREKRRREQQDNLRRIEIILRFNKAPLPTGGIRLQGCLMLVKCGGGAYAPGKQWAYVFDDGFFCCEAARTVPEQEGMFDPTEISDGGGGVAPAVIAGIARKAAKGQGDRALVLEVDGWGKCEFEAASAEEANAWFSEVALGRLREAALADDRNNIIRRHCSPDDSLSREQTLAALREIDGTITDQEAFSMFDRLDVMNVGRIGAQDLINAFKKIERKAVLPAQLQLVAKTSWDFGFNLLALFVAVVTAFVRRVTSSLR
eukprot:CAMPEP_0113723062 /NCGR_PEP_ID=MMETSP0038_2-20120614/38164_1 /TAXON_ID=2898 /ORGANISM="Cryptomonas paramecium" /LENGTH=501 /DNA_ID=CAMNT_0000652509 /DNA_START=163 /DNA_END=1668 /DNA_ORIENTATION=- /assembly_acc=CAM_ASM_000170